MNCAMLIMMFIWLNSNSRKLRSYAAIIVSAVDIATLMRIINEAFGVRFAMHICQMPI